MIGRFVACLSLVLSTTAVTAGTLETPPDEPPVAGPVAASVPSNDWTGFYAGVSALRGRFSDNGGVTSGDTDGFGVQAGYLRDLGTFVVGGELAYAKGDYDVFPGNDWNTTRLKLIGGYDAGRFLPYGFLGMSRYDVNGVTVFSDTVTIYGIGAKFAVTPRTAVGLEYLVENKDEYDGSFDMENSDLSLRLDLRF